MLCRLQMLSKCLPGGLTGGWQSRAILTPGSLPTLMSFQAIPSRWPHGISSFNLQPSTRIPFSQLCFFATCTPAPERAIEG